MWVSVSLDMGGYRAWQAATEELEAGWAAERTSGVRRNNVRPTHRRIASMDITPFDLRCPQAPRFKQQKQQQTAEPSRRARTSNHKRRKGAFVT